MVRQVMRAFFPEDLMPAIHYSSFDCADAVRIPVSEGTDLTHAGFIEQVKSVRVGIEALVARVDRREQGLIVEGVHLVPGYLDATGWGEALVVEMVMAVPDARRHRAHFTTRDWQTGGVRPLRKYLKHFAEIRHVQDLILDAATAFRVKVIETTPSTTPSRRPWTRCSRSSPSEGLRAGFARLLPRIGGIRV